MKIVELERLDQTQDYFRGKLLKQLQTLLDETRETYTILFKEEHPVYTTHLIKRYNTLLKKSEIQYPVELVFRELSPVNEDYGSMDKAEWVLPSLKLSIASLISFLEYEDIWARHKKLQMEHTNLKKEYKGIHRVR